MADRVPLLEIGKLHARVSELKATKGAPPWSEAVVLTDDIQAFIICHLPGQPNDTHYHLHDEWWVVLQGEINWYIEDEPSPSALARATSSSVPRTAGTTSSLPARSRASVWPSTPAANSTATTAPAASRSSFSLSPLGEGRVTGALIFRFRVTIPSCDRRSS